MEVVGRGSGRLGGESKVKHLWKIYGYLKGEEMGDEGKSTYVAGSSLDSAYLELKRWKYPFTPRR